MLPLLEHTSTLQTVSAMLPLLEEEIARTLKPAKIYDFRMLSTHLVKNTLAPLYELLDAK